MQSAQTSDLFYAGPQIQVVSIAEDDLCTEFFQNVLRDALTEATCPPA